MPDNRKYYVICDDNCKFEGMTKEQVVTTVTQIVNDGSVGDIDTGFVTRIKEQNTNAGLKMWVGTQAEYNAIAEKEINCFYIISDDETEKDIISILNEQDAKLEAIAKCYEAYKPWNVDDPVRISPIHDGVRLYEISAADIEGEGTTFEEVGISFKAKHYGKIRLAFTLFHDSGNVHHNLDMVVKLNGSQIGKITSEDGAGRTQQYIDVDVQKGEYTISFIPTVTASGGGADGSTDISRIEDFYIMANYDTSFVYVHSLEC